MLRLPCTLAQMSRMGGVVACLACRCPPAVLRLWYYFVAALSAKFVVTRSGPPCTLGPALHDAAACAALCACPALAVDVSRARSTSCRWKRCWPSLTPP